MKTDHASGDQFAASADLIENKALRIGETNKANEEQALKFARTDEERRQIKLAVLKRTLRDIDALSREARTLSDEPPATEDRPCSN